MSNLHSISVEHSTHGARTIGRANNTDAGIVVASVAPELRRRFELGWALLEALGKRADVAGAGRHDDLNWEVLHAWLYAHHIRHVVLLDAQWLPLDLIGDVAALAATCNVDVWLVAHEVVTDSYLDTIDQWPHRSGSAHELVTVIEQGLRRIQDPTPDEFPDVPTDNWPTFRHACLHQLTDSEFAIVDATYRAAFRAARTALADTVISEDTMLTHLRQALHGCATVAEMTTTVRAVQVAVHRAGWLLHADLGRMLLTAEEMSRAAIHSPTTWRRMRAYREPYRAAAAALAACDLTVGAMLDLTVGDVADDGSAVTSNEAVLPVAEGAQEFLRAQLNHRRIMGAPSHEPLFADDDGVLRDRTLALALTVPATEVGVPIVSLATSRSKAADNTRWRHRWGISVQRLR